MTLISHEIPKQLFPIHDLINDYPYVLAHLIGQDQEYTDFYIRKCKNATFSILDNSAFELGKSVDFEILIEAAERVKPTHVVVPDWVNDCDKTIEFLKAFLSILENRYGSLHRIPFKLIAVIQGTNMGELYKSLNEITYWKRQCPAIEIVAMPYDTIPGTDYHNIRYIVFQHMKNVLKDNHLQVHLLGLQNYSEYVLYTKEDKELIYSVDSSAPIVYGWNDINFSWGGTDKPKPKEKLADNLDRTITPDQMRSISHNVLTIRQIIKGKKL